MSISDCSSKILNSFFGFRLNPVQLLPTNIIEQASTPSLFAMNIFVLMNSSLFSLKIAGTFSTIHFETTKSSEHLPTSSAS